MLPEGIKVSCHIHVILANLGTTVDSTLIQLSGNNFKVTSIYRSARNIIYYAHINIAFLFPWLSAAISMVIVQGSNEGAIQIYAIR